MQDIGNHMDDLFQMAGEHYRLKPVDSDWENLAAKLPAVAPIVAPVAASTKTKKARLLLFLLLPLLLVSVAIKKVNYGDTAINELSIDKPETPIATGSSQTPTVSLHPFTKSNNTIAIKESKTPFTVIENAIATLDATQSNNSNYFNKQGTTTKHEQTVAVDASNETFKANQDNNEADEQGAAQSATTPTITAVKRNNFYIGAVTGINYNQVKQQGFTKPGVDAGVVVGYNINPKIAIETGLIITNKKYESSGDYFSMKKMGTSMPADAKLMHVAGTSTLLQLPVTLRYTFLNNKKLQLFASTAVSSYVMLNEKNNYTTMLNGVQQNMQGSYKKASGYYAASVDVSAGATLFTNTTTQLRIAPYLQLPVKGLGMGNMMISGAGLQLGIVKQIK